MGSAEQRRARDADPSHDVHVQDPLFERRTCSGVSSSTHVLPLKRNSKKPSSATHSESQFEEQRSRSQPSECDHLSETASPAVSCMKQSDSFADLRTPLSPKAKVSRFTCEVLLVARLAITLWSYLGLGWRWTWNCTRLFLYAFILMPGFLQMVYYYFFSPQVERSIVYGRKPRNRLDIYYPTLPSPSEKDWPVVIFITGGAWTIGYKAWGALLGRRLSERGILVASMDYRNFPQGSCQDMLEDVNNGIAWVLRCIHRFGGDPKNVYLCGQSAGGHLTATAMLTQVERRIYGNSQLARGHPWDPTHLCGFVGVSSPYALHDLADHLDRRGLYKSMFRSIMSIDGQTMLQTLSPVHIAEELKPFLRENLPEVLLLHGKLDKSVPYEGAESFAAVLTGSGVQCRCKLYEGKSHTQPLIEDPMRGGRDCLMEDILNIVLKTDNTIDQKPLVPEFLAKIASFVCPF